MYLLQSLKKTSKVLKVSFPAESEKCLFIQTLKGKEYLWFHAGSALVHVHISHIPYTDEPPAISDMSSAEWTAKSGR